MDFESTCQTACQQAQWGPCRHSTDFRRISLLNHFIVVLGPLTAFSRSCARCGRGAAPADLAGSAAGRGHGRLDAVDDHRGRVLSARVGPASPVLTNHEQLGSTLIYVVAALMSTVIVLAAVHVRQERGRTVTITLQAVVAVAVIAAAVATLVQTYRVGDSGARAAWGT